MRKSVLCAVIAASFLVGCVSTTLARDTRTFYTFTILARNPSKGTVDCTGDYLFARNEYVARRLVREQMNERFPPEQGWTARAAGLVPHDTEKLKKELDGVS